jgi:branched-chain amino acid transport system ATP-binding protein
MTAVLELVDLAVGYGDRVVVEKICLRVEPGQIVGILGGNGTGKTTILRSVYGEARIFGGSVRLGGEAGQAEPRRMPAALGIGLLLQGDTIFPSLTVRENIVIGLRSRKPELDARLTETLDLFPEVRPLLGKAGAVLSGGERQIVGICRALAMRPRLLLLDEPGAGLSPSLLDRLLQRLRKVARERQLGILLVEQHVAAALRAVDRVVLLRDGAQVLEGSAVELDEAKAVAVLLGEQRVS